MHKEQTEVVIGEATYRDENELTVGKLLRMPFKKIKYNAVPGENSEH